VTTAVIGMISENARYVPSEWYRCGFARAKGGAEILVKIMVKGVQTRTVRIP